MCIFINMSTTITMDQSGVPLMVITEEGTTVEVQLAQLMEEAKVQSMEVTIRVEAMVL